MDRDFFQLDDGVMISDDDTGVEALGVCREDTVADNGVDAG